MAVPEPITRLEQYWAAILDKIQGGGSAPVLETLTVTANDTYRPETGVDGFNEVIVNVPSIQNSIETITSTLSAPFGNMSESQIMELVPLVADGTVTCTLRFDATAIGMGTGTLISQPGGAVATVGRLFFEGISTAGIDVTNWQALAFVTLVDTVQSAYLLSAGAVMDMSAYLSRVPSVLEIFYHPMPN